MTFRTSSLCTGRWSPALRILPVLLLCTFAPGLLQAAAPATGAQISYTKVLKGSDPEFERIIVNADGSGSYDGRSLSAPARPVNFQLSAPATQSLFELAADLKDFNGVKLESGKHVADLGLKTFQYEAGGEDYSCQFNYSTNRDAQELTGYFEGIGAVERHILALKYDLRYDLLGIPKELMLTQEDLNNNVLFDPQMMTGILSEITRDPRVMHFAQVRAQRIISETSGN